MAKDLDDCGIKFAAFQHGAEYQAHAYFGSDCDVWVKPFEAAKDTSEIGACGVFGELEQKSSGKRRLKEGFLTTSVLNAAVIRGLRVQFQSRRSCTMSNNMVIPRVLAIYATIVSRILPVPARSAMQLEEPEGTVVVAVDPVISSDNIVALNHATPQPRGLQSSRKDQWFVCHIPVNAMED